MPGTWDAGTTLAYQWLADGTPIAGDDRADLHARCRASSARSITVRGDRHQAGLHDGHEDQRPDRGRSPLGDLTATPTPTITGTPKVGVELTGVPGHVGRRHDADLPVVGRRHPGRRRHRRDLHPGARRRSGAVVTFAVTGTKPGYTAGDQDQRRRPRPVAAGDLTPHPDADHHRHPEGRRRS